jgi:hypothetical protein
MRECDLSSILRPEAFSSLLGPAWLELLGQRAKARLSRLSSLPLLAPTSTPTAVPLSTPAPAPALALALALASAPSMTPTLATMVFTVSMTRVLGVATAASAIETASVGSAGFLVFSRIKRGTGGGEEGAVAGDGGDGAELGAVGWSGSAAIAGSAVGTEGGEMAFDSADEAAASPIAASTSPALESTKAELLGRVTSVIPAAWQRVEAGVVRGSGPSSKILWLVKLHRPFPGPYVASPRLLLDISISRAGWDCGAHCSS